MTYSPPPLDQHQCHFGHWLAERADQLLVQHPAYARIVPLHADVHHKAVELVGLKQRGEAALALTRFLEVEMARDALLEEMRQLIHGAARR